MITSNADEIAKELQKYAEDVERKLKAMVVGFANDIANEGAKRTKVIKESTLQTEKWQNIYSDRQDNYRISIKPGYHRGAWQYAEGSLVFDSRIRDDSERYRELANDAELMYTLGDSFLVGLIGPVAEYAGPKIDVVENAVTSAFKSDVKRHFDNG